MQKFRAYFLRFCSLVVCFVLFLVPLNAYADTWAYEPIDTTTGQWEIDYVLNEVNEEYEFVAELGVFNGKFGDIGTSLGSYRVSPISSNEVLNGFNMYEDEIRLYRSDGALLANVGESVIINLNDIVFDQNAYSGTTQKRRSNIDVEEIEKFSVSVVSDDGQIQEVILMSGADITNELTLVADGSPLRYYDLHFEIKNLPFNVVQYVVDIYTGADSWNNNITSSLNGNTWDYSGAGTRYFGPYKSILIYEVEPKTNDGLLSGIIEWVRRIYDGIISLPQNIWLNIKAGLMELLVPDETFMLDYKEDWDVLLSDSLGGVYQAVDLVDETAQRFMDGGYSSGVIEFPMVHIPVGKNLKFDFGGWDVEILPDWGKFHVLLDAIKVITNALATFYVINAFKNRFERTLEE